MFESDPSFKNSHMIISCILCQAQYRIPALTLVNSEASAYAFIDKSFVQHYDLLLHPLIYSCHLCEFDGQSALTDDITHIAETILALKNYVKKLFLYVTDLNQYLIILSLLWLHRHVIDVNFEFNTLTMFLSFCLTHCCHTSVTISGATWEEEAFLFLKESQQVWELEDQENCYGSWIRTGNTYVDSYSIYSRVAYKLSDL